MKYTLKNLLFASVFIGFYFIEFNGIGFAGDNGGIQQKEHLGLESPEAASQHEKDSLSYQSFIKGHRQLKCITTNPTLKMISMLKNFHQKIQGKKRITSGLN